MSSKAVAIPKPKKDEIIPKSPKSNWIMVQIIFLVCVLVFFYASPHLFRNLNEYLLTPVGSRVEVTPNKFVTINAWTYSEKDDVMEVELGVENLKYDGDGECSFSALIRGLNVSEGHTRDVLVTDDLAVVQIYDLPSGWNEVALRVSIGSDPSFASLFTNRLDVTRVDTIPVQTETEYRVGTLQRQVSDCEANIETCRNEIEEAKVRIANIEQSIAEIEAQKKYMTAAQIEEADSSIDSLQSRIHSEQTSITEYEASIREYEARIELLNDEIADVQAGKTGTVQQQNQD